MLFIRKAGKRIMPIQRKKGCGIVPKEKWSFEDFIRCVETGSQEFVRKMHSILSEGGCKIEVKEAKSGYVVSYRFGKKTLINYVFRKKGLLVRIYAEHIREYICLLYTSSRAAFFLLKTLGFCAAEKKDGQIRMEIAAPFRKQPPAWIEIIREDEI